MDSYCKNECEDRGKPNCALPSVREVAVAHGRIAVRRAMETVATFGRSLGDERFEPNWQLDVAVTGLKDMRLRVAECVNEHLYSNVVELHPSSTDS